MSTVIPAVIITALHVDGWTEQPATYGRRIWTHPSGATCRIGRAGRIDVWTHPSRDATFAPGTCPVGVAAYLGEVIQ